MTVAINCDVSPARTFAFDGLTVTIVEPEVDPGSDGDVGLVVVVFAMPPHAQATSARRSGSNCTAEGLVEQFVELIALCTPRLVF
ncbi:MAG TPA: hypothetical protein VGJ06_01595 [Candidatus Acidoferrum sp.]